MKPDDILISDVGAHKLWISRMYPVYKPNTCIISNGFASMGIALPGAIAAKLVCPERQVIAIMGDGGFLMNSQEIETATRLGLSFVSLIFHDNSYGVIKSKQLNFFGRSAFVDFSNPDFVKYAESFGAKGYRVESANDLKPILQDAIKQRGVSVIDCPVDYSENIFGLSKKSINHTKVGAENLQPLQSRSKYFSALLPQYKMNNEVTIAYFSMEIGISNNIPTYSGGLGVLAGDTIKSGADLKIPLVAVTLLSKKVTFVRTSTVTEDKLNTLSIGIHQSF